MKKKERKQGEKSIGTRYPVEILAMMKQLAQLHGRSFNSEVIWAYVNISASRRKGCNPMAKATTTIRQVLTHQPEHRAWFAATQALFNRVAAFYFEVIQAHEGILDLSNKEALTALEKLTHTTQKNPTPVMP